MKDVSFSEWVHISNKDKLLQHGRNCPGIYAIAYSSQNLAGEPFDHIKDIIYIGMSKSKKGLKGRLYQFFSTID